MYPCKQISLSSSYHYNKFILVIICSFWVTYVLLLGCSSISSRAVALFSQIGLAPVRRVKYGGAHWVQSSGLDWEQQPGEEVLLLLTHAGPTPMLNCMPSVNLGDLLVPAPATHYQRTSPNSAPLSFTQRLATAFPPRVFSLCCSSPLCRHFLNIAAWVTPASEWHQRPVSTQHYLCQVDADILTSAAFWV